MDSKKNASFKMLGLLTFLVLVGLIYLGTNTDMFAVRNQASIITSDIQSDTCATYDVNPLVSLSSVDKNKTNKDDLRKDINKYNAMIKHSSKALMNLDRNSKQAMEREIKGLVEKRFELVRKAMKSNDNTTVMLAINTLSNEERMALKDLNSDCLEKEDTIEGKVISGHSHYTKEENDELEVDFHFLDLGDGKQIKLFGSNEILNSYNDKKVKIKGFKLANSLIVDGSEQNSIALVNDFSLFKKVDAFEPDGQGPQVTLIMPVIGPAGTPVPTTNFATVVSNLDSHLSQSSLGAASVSAIVPTGGWINLPYDPCSGNPNTHSDAFNAVNAQVDFSQVKRIIWFNAGPNCSGAAAAYPTVSTTTPDGTFNIYYAHVSGYHVNQPHSYIHEYSHTFGVNHANVYYCSVSAPIGTPNNSGCDNFEYGSGYSVMGGSNALLDMAHFNRIWGTQSTVQDITVPGTYVINTRTLLGTNPNSVKVRYGKYHYLFAEYRQPGSTSWEQFGSSDAGTGALIYLDYPAVTFNGSTNFTNSSVSIDPTPPANGTSSSLAVGQTLNFPATGASFKVLSKTANDLTLEVNPGTPDIIMPTVSLTAPTSGSTLSGTVTMTATATDNNTVTRVCFVSTMGLGMGCDYTAPYSVSWNTTTFPDGNYNVYANVVDGAGNGTKGGNVPVTINNSGAPLDTTPPVVAITSPLNGATVSGTIPINVTATDNVAIQTVDISVDGATAGSSQVAPYTFSLNTTTYTDGQHILQARAWDIAGNMNSTTININVYNSTGDTTPPIISTVMYSSVTSNSTNILWNTNEAANGQVEYGTTTSYGYQSALNTNYTLPHSITLTGLTPGTLYHYRVKSADLSGNMATSPDFTFTTSASGGDVIAPTVSMTAPTTGATLSGTATISAIASDNVAVSSVSFYRGTSFLGQDFSSPYSISWDSTTTPNGTYQFTARATDPSGNVGISTAVFADVSNTTPPPIDTTPPSVGTLQVIGGSGTTLSGQVTLSITATDTGTGATGMQKVDFYRGTTWIATDTTPTATNEYSINFDTTLIPNGAYDLYAKAYDLATPPNTANSTTLNVTVSNTGDITPPTVAVTSPLDGDTITGVSSYPISVDANDIGTGVASVQVYIDGAPYGSPVFTPPYQVNWDQNGVLNGTHTITAIATDNAGNFAQATVVSVTVVNTTPSITWIFPTDGVHVKSNITYTLGVSTTGPITQIRYFRKGVQHCKSFVPPNFNCPWTPQGKKRAVIKWVAKGYDSAGTLIATSPTITVTRDKQTP